MQSSEPHILSRLLMPLGLGLALLFGLCLSPGQAAALDKVSISLLWINQAQFSGFYMAQDLGIYRKHGLEVKLIPGGPGVSVLEALEEGKSDFAVLFLASGIKNRAHGMDLVHLAQMVHRSGAALVARKSSGIKGVGDMAGCTVGLWDGDSSLAPRALFKSRKIKVKAVHQGSSVSPFVQGALDVISAMTYNEVHLLYQAGFDYEELSILSLSALGYDFPEDGLYTLGSTWRDKKDICRRVARATLEGWQAAARDQEQALDSVMKRVDRTKQASNRCHQRHMLKTILELMEPDQKGHISGRLDPREFQGVQRVLLEQQAISRPADMEMLATDAVEDKP